MKRALSIALVLTLIFNKVSASCIAKSTESFQSESTQVESQAKENLSKSDEDLKRVVDQVLAELKKRDESKSDASKNEKQNKSSLPVRVLKILCKPVYWFGKAGVFVVRQFLWLILGALMAILGSVGTTYAIFKTGGAGLEKAEGPIKNIIEKAKDALQNILASLIAASQAGVKVNLDLSDALGKLIPVLELVNSIEKGAVSAEMSELVKFLEENPQLAEGILSHMFSLLRNCRESMQPDEFKSYLKKVAMLFHPDKLKNLRNISEEDAKIIYQLTTELLSKQQG